MQKKVTLLELNLINWSGITNRYLMNEGQNRFTGRNGVGKTRLGNAETWIHTGKNLEGTTKNEVKSLDGQEVQSKCFHAAFARYDINGTEIMIGKSLQEKWTKPRGELEEVRSGNDIKYYVGGMSPDDKETVTTTAKKFQALLDQNFGSDYQKACQINYISSLHWKELRDFLTGLCPVDKEKLIDSIDGFKDLLKEKSPEIQKAFADDRSKTLKKKFSDNAAAISERQKDVDSIKDLSIGQITKELDDCQKEIKSCESNISKLKQGDDTESFKKIQELNQQLSKARNDFETKKQAAVDAENERQRNIKGIEAELKRLANDLDLEKVKMKGLIEHGQKIISAKKAIRQTTAESISEMCSGECGQKLPADVLNKLKETFNQDKAENLKAKQSELDANNAAGLECKQEIERIEKLIGEHNVTLINLQTSEKDIIISSKSNVEIETLEKQIAELQKPVEGENPQLKNFESRLESLNEMLKTAQEKRAQFKALDDSKARLKDLEEERKKLSAENDKIQTFLTKYDEYVRLSAAAVQDPVNQLIPGVKFKMFQMSEMNKQVDACIVCNDEWKPYDSMLSTGEKIGVDLACTAFMQKHLSISAPIWIDERQSYTGTIPLDCQWFELVTKEKIETLTKEI